MRVLQLANDYIDKRLYRLLFEHLDSLGISGYVYVPVSKKRRDYPDFGADVFVDPCFTFLDRVLFFSKQRKMKRSVMQWKSTNEIDLLHAHTLFSAGYTAYRLNEQFGIPYIVAVRNTDKNVFFKYMLHLRKTGVRIMQKASQIVFLSSVYRDSVIDTYVPENMREEIREKSIVIPNGIDEFFLKNKVTQPKKVNKPLRLIYIGDIDDNKNLYETVAAAVILRSKGIDTEITAVGEIKSEKCDELIKNTPFLHFYEKCKKEDVAGYLDGADIFVMPSHKETFGLVYAEAMSRGLPVIYTRGQGFDGQFSDGTVGYAVSDTDARELALKIEQIIENYETISQNCISLVERFDWSIIAKQYSELYNKTINRK